MSNEATTTASLPVALAEDAATGIKQQAVDRILNMALSGVGKIARPVQAAFRGSYERYLKGAYQRYNQVCTLVNKNQPRPIVGKDNIYIYLPVRDDISGKKYDTFSAKKLLEAGENLLICGSGGAGKSMLLRYLFLNTCDNATHIPVLLELRKISAQNVNRISLFDLIYKTMEDFDTALPKEAFEASLRQGKYLFLLDAYDEIAGTHAAKAGEEIQRFVSKYPKNSFIMTSREDNFASFQTFTKLKTQPMTKSQAVSLAKKFRSANEKTVVFCKQLEEKLFEEHQSFAENPLLLSMMFLTFMENNSIPNHLVDFYDRTFDALYCKHDSHNKGAFVREFRCGRLSKQEFTLVFSQFCFQSYRKNIHEFSQTEIIDRLSNGISRIKVNCSAEDFLYDLQRNICLIVQEGTSYRFAHRSFQDYFAAYFTNWQNDDIQKKIYSRFAKKSDNPYQFVYFYRLCCQMNRKRYVKNALEEYLLDASRKLQDGNSIQDVLGVTGCIGKDIDQRSDIFNGIIRRNVSTLHWGYKDSRFIITITYNSEVAMMEASQIVNRQTRGWKVLPKSAREALVNLFINTEKAKNKTGNDKEPSILYFNDLQNTLSPSALNDFYKMILQQFNFDGINELIFELLAELVEDTIIDDLDDL